MRGAALRDELAALQARFDGRESREEDLRRIAALQAAVAQRDALVANASEEMRYYKIELQNREENYNQLFGKKPTIGKINPLSRRGSSRGGDALALGLGATAAPLAMGAPGSFTNGSAGGGSGPPSRAGSRRNSSTELKLPPPPPAEDDAGVVGSDAAADAATADATAALAAAAGAGRVLDRRPSGVDRVAVLDRRPSTAAKTGPGLAAAAAAAAAETLGLGLGRPTSAAVGAGGGGRHWKSSK